MTESDAIMASGLWQIGDAALSPVGRVYRCLVSLTRHRVYHEPTPVKAHALAVALCQEGTPIKPHTVNAILDELIARGWLQEHGRGLHNVRRITATMPLRGMIQ